jgi:fimbrial chaperone protein
MQKGAAWVCTTLMGLAAEQSAAGSFSVAPTRVELDAAHRTAVVTLRNVEPKPLTVQVSITGWSQGAGEDKYEATRELLATPPVFTLAPDSEQIVRIALRRAPDAALERPYRIFFQEVPQAAAVGSNSLNIALRVGVPIFVMPSSKTDAKLRWEARHMADGKIAIDAINDGSAHIQVTGLELSATGATASRPISEVKYILPGSRMTWQTELPPGADSASSLQLAGHSDRGDLTATVSVASQ